MNQINKEYSYLRKQLFLESRELDLELIETVKDCPSHAFLVNPAGQNVYLYLTKYVKFLSELHFKREISSLKIMDWGCGKGHVTLCLIKLGAKPISCDLKTDMSDSSFGQETPILNRYNIYVKPLEHKYELPFDDGTIDVVLSFGVLEHVENELESLKEINRVLQPKGLFFCFFLPYTFSWTQRLAHARGNLYHERLYSKSAVYKLINNCGFDLLDIWHRQLLPKNSVEYAQYYLFERIDQFLTKYTPLKFLATNIEFVACKR